MKRRVLFLGLVLAGVAAAFLVACSGDDDDSSGSTAATATSPVAAAATNTAAPPAAAATNTTTAPPASGATAVRIGDFNYTPNQVQGRVGQALTLNVTNGGALPHTFTITGLAGADTGNLTAGQSRTITFTPTAAGAVQFFCSVHGAATMSGTLTVQ